LERELKRSNIMYIPAIIFLVVFIVYPFLTGFRISFTDWDGYSQTYRYIGIENFKLLSRDQNVRIAFVNTLIYGFGSTFFQQILGLAYALLLNKPFRGRTLARTAVYLQVLISPIIMGYMWYFILKYDHGALNDLLGLFGIKPVLWLSDPTIAVWVIVVLNTIQYVGVSMVIYLAGLQGIPSMYYEAAAIDGVTLWQEFRHITLPLLYPSIVSSVIINVIGGLKLFDIIRALTGGGPGYTTHSLSTLIYTTYFQSQSAGYAAAIGVLLFVSILVSTIILQIFFKKKGGDYIL